MPSPINLDLVRTIQTSPGSPVYPFSFSDRFTKAGKVVWLRDYAKGDGSTDDTTAIQNLITAVPDGTTILAYPGEKYVVSSTLNEVSKTHVRIIGAEYGDCLYPGANGADAPGFLWNGATNGTMFNVIDCFNPTISGFIFTSNFAINNFIVLDRNTGGVTPTAGYVEKCLFQNPTFNINHVGVNISPTSTVNVENYTVRRCGFNGAGSTFFAGKDIVGDGVTKTITSASNPWTGANGVTVGQRIRLSWQVQGQGGSFATAGFIDDTIATINNPGSIILTTNVPPNLTGITCHVGQCYGVGILNGPSQNAKHHQFIDNFSNRTQIAICCIGGSFSVYRHLGESDDFGVVYGHTLSGPNNMPISGSSLMTESCWVDSFVSEANIIGIKGTGVPVLITNPRIDNTKADARGFFQLTDATITNASPVTSPPGPNQVVIGRNGGFGGAGNILSIGSTWGQTAAAVGVTTINGYQFAASQWKSKHDKFDDSVGVDILGAMLNGGGLISNPRQGMFQMFANALPNTVVPGSTITSFGGGGIAVLAVYSEVRSAWVVVTQL